VEVWQARPDGTYSSLRVGQQEGDCRASMSLSTDDDDDSFIVFETFAPGSTGSLGGLGPSKIEFTPFGPPVIHFLATASKHAPTLIDFPVLLDRKTLNARSFYWPDWRGQAWVKQSGKDPAYKITSWKGDQKNNQVEIELDIFLQVQDDSTGSLAMCPSLIYGLPSSFFLEPITECAPSMLNFFAL
jgi:hypothetical protein